MKQQANEIINKTVAEGDVPTFAALADLPVADDAQIKGGPIVLEDVKITSYQLGVLDNNGHGTHVAGTLGAVGNNNHNETVAEDDAPEDAALADLPVEEAAQIKGGSGGGGGAGKVHFSDLHLTAKV